MILYAVLIAFSAATLKGAALVIAVLIVVAHAVKSYVHHLRSRIE
jgi:hypothetical protein